MARLALWLLPLALAVTPLSVQAEELQPKSLWTFSKFRTRPGMTKQYLQFLATVWKARRKILIEEGVVVSYHVFEVKGQREGEPDIIIATEYSDTVSFARRAELEQLVRSKLKANPPQGAPNVDHETMREWMGSMDLEELDL
ncbi:hypothetical protein [Novosphingobium sp. BW1]|uniref:hypothetical protein n=1 Tax=Novosphingobium sp. BW1 TaxID=2592621 RepID=UPI0011DEB5AF|nr:hypothetical protein [Novosphingobium sp. BW1]TYC94420.1 hypothetical protein FMM79_00745 [Novosphingobium sp. BW1]